MKIYLAINSNHCDGSWFIIGAYATKEEAEKAADGRDDYVDEYEIDHSCECPNTKCGFCHN